MPTFSRSLEQSLHRALAIANERHHEYATLEHLLLALIVDQRQQQMFQGRIFVMPLIGDGERPVERLLEAARERWHQISISICIGRPPNLTFFPSRIAEDADVFWQSPSPASLWSPPPHKYRSHIRRSRGDAHAT